MATVIDESGVVQSWTAHYWRHHVRCQYQADSLTEALRFLADGEDWGSLSADSVTGPDGEVVIANEEIFDAVYGYGRFAEPQRSTTIREIAGVA